MSGQSLLWRFWALELFQGVGGSGQLLHGSAVSPRVGVANQATGETKEPSPGQPELAGLPRDVERLPVARQSLLWRFWAAELFQGVGGAGCCSSRV